jgi:RNA polymerase sigma-70 factor, ECF subfamily
MVSTAPREESDERKERFMQLLLPVRDRLVRFARGMARSPEDVEDLVGDTMLAAFEGFDRLRHDVAFLSYLFTIAHRIHRQRTWKARLFGAFDREHAESIPYQGTSPESTADVALLHRALALLPDRQRETVVLFELAGLSLEEIKEIQGGSLSGVKSRLTRGRERLAQLLGHAPPEKSTPESSNGTTRLTGSIQHSKSNG